MTEEQILDLNNRFISVKNVWVQWMEAGLPQLNTFAVDFQFWILGEDLLTELTEAFETQNYSVQSTEVKSDQDEIGYEMIVGIRQKWTLDSVLQYYKMFFELAIENDFDFEGCGAMLKQV